MASPLVIHGDSRVVLPPQFFGSIAYYALLASYRHVYIHDGMRFDKRFKSTHRTTIADTRGILDLTVPVTKPHSSSQATWNDISVSPHGAWWNVHLTAFESSYGRTPFFEFYIDSLMPVFGAGVCGRPITELDAIADETVRKLLYLDNEVTHLNERDIPGHAADMRHIMPDTPQHHQYYQVRAGKLGFISGLSILDLLFNIGPEAPLYLKKLIG